MKLKRTPSVPLALTSVVALSVLAGCSTDLADRKGRDGVNDDITKVQGQIDDRARTLDEIEAIHRPSNVRKNDGIYLGQDGFRTGRGDPLPRRFEREDSIVLNLADPIPLPELAQMLQQMTGMRFDFNDLVSGFAVGSATGGGGAGGAGGSEADSSGGAEAPSEGGGSPDLAPTDGATGGMGEALDPLSMPIRVRYYGPLSGLLDYVAAQTSVDWEYRGGRVKFVGPQTTTYTIWAQQGQYMAEGASGGASEAFGSSNPTTTTLNQAYDYWQDIEAGIASIIPEANSRYSINRNTGSVVVTAPRAIHERIADFVAQENGRLSRQVAVKVDVLAFSDTDSDSRSANLNAILEQAAAGLNFSLMGPGAALDSATGLGVSVVDVPGGVAANNVGEALEDFTGSDAVLQALAERGKVAVLTSSSVVAMNNVPTPVNFMTEKAYLASVTSEETDDGTTTTLETGVVNSGMSMTVTPRILSAGDVVVTYSLALSELKGIETFSSGENMVQLPEIDTRNFMQTVSMESGDAIVIASYDTANTSRTASGPFNPALWGLGGTDGYSADKTKIVVVLRPIVIEGRNAPHASR